MPLTWAKALAWRLQRQLLDPVGTGSVVDVVGRLGGVPAWPDAVAELATGARRTDGRSGDAAEALAAGRLVKAFTFRGGTHLMTPQDAGAYLAVRASGRMWERASWQQHYELAPADWPRLRETVRDAVADGPLTRSELVAAIGLEPRYRRVHDVLAEGNDTLLKPLTWQGDVGLGPVRDGEPTFLRLDRVAGWAGIPDLDEAGPRVVAAHLRSCGPASTEQLHDRVGKGLGARRRDVTGWLATLGDRCAEITIEGDRVLVLAEDLDELRAATPSGAVRLLPGRDPWLMGPGTSDVRVVPAARRDVGSRTAHLVVARGVVAGTWTLRGERLVVEWFGESGRVPRTALDEEAARLARFVGRPVDDAFDVVTSVV